jgi:DNA-binding response OmpR family regulator
MKPERAWKVLLVEDDTDSAEALESLFGLHGIETLWAADGSAAMQALDSIQRHGETSPDFVLLDLNLPNTDTVALGRALRSHVVGCPVVLVSATSPQVLDQTAQGIGAVAAVRKPFTMDDLLGVFHRHGRAEPVSQTLEARR